MISKLLVLLTLVVAIVLQFIDYVLVKAIKAEKFIHELALEGRLAVKALCIGQQTKLCVQFRLLSTPQRIDNAGYLASVELSKISCF